MFVYFAEGRDVLNIGFDTHLGRFKDECPARLYLKAKGDNEAKVSVELVGVLDGTQLPDPSTRLADFEQTPHKWFMTVRQPKRILAPIPIGRFYGFKTKASLRNDFRGVQEVVDPEPK